MKNEVAIVLVSGGMDSCVTAAIANEKYRLAFLHVNYGQRTEARELRAFNEIADHYQAEKRLTISIEHLKVIGGSALTDENIPVPEADPSQSAIQNPTIRNSCDLRPLPERPSPFHCRFLGRGHRRNEDLHRRRRRGQLRLSRLPRGVLSGIQQGHRDGNKAGNADRDHHAAHPSQEVSHRERRHEAPRTPSSNLELLPEQRPCLRQVRKLYAAVEGIQRGGSGRPDSVRNDRYLAKDVTFQNLTTFQGKGENW